MSRIEIKNVNTTSYYMNKLLDLWISQKITVFNNCYMNSIYLYINLKKNFTNKVGIRVGSILYDDIYMGHAWITIMISDIEHILDITQLYCFRILENWKMPEKNEYINNKQGFRINKEGNLEMAEDPSDIIRDIAKNIPRIHSEMK